MPRSPEGALAKTPRTEKFRKEVSERKARYEDNSVQLKSINEAIEELQGKHENFETGPVSIAEADANIPNAFLLYEKVNEAVKNNPAAFESLSLTPYRLDDRATAYCKMATELVREERQLEKMDRSNPEFSKRFMSFWDRKSKFVNFSNQAGIDFLGHMGREGLNPENLSPENAAAEGRKAKLNIPSAQAIINELSRHVDDRGDAYNKYLFMVNNYVKAVKLGDPSATANAERVWKQYNEDFGLSHDMMKVIALEWLAKEKK